MTFVAIKDGKPTKVPAIEPSTPLETKNYQDAETRRLKRFALRKQSSKQTIDPISIPKTLSLDMLTPTQTTFNEISSDATFAQVVEIVFPEHANSLGFTFGGRIIQWMEYCGAMAASRVARAHLSTASIDQLNFMKSIKIGDVVSIRGIVSASFKHSVEVYVTVNVESFGGEGYTTVGVYSSFPLINVQSNLHPLQ